MVWFSQHTRKQSFAMAFNLIPMPSPVTFSWLDYTIFGLYLTASVGVGIYSARGSKSLGDYFLAGRGMNSILVAMSILAALFSGISYLAGPADVYKNGFGFAYVVLAFFIATPFTVRLPRDAST